MSSVTPSANRSALAGAIVIVCVALLFPAAWKLPPVVGFAAVLALMTLIVLVLGKAITGHWLGVLINERNVMSLSQFQLTGWTIVVLGAYFTYAVTRMRVGETITPPIADPLAVGIDTNLWTLLGISTTSLVGSALILGTKKDKQPSPVALQKAATLTATSAGSNNVGLLYVNPDKADAQFTDLFQGDEVGNTTHIDVAKVQMFFFTVIALFAFALMVARELRTGNVDLLTALPVLPTGLVALLGISHAGYLGGKTVTHTT